MLQKMNPFGDKPKKAKGGDDTYAHDIAEFNNIYTQVKAVDAAINDYEKKIKGTLNASALCLLLMCEICQ
jgi:hypothetical protein